MQRRTIYLTALILFAVNTGLLAESLRINDAQALAAGKRLWHNECAGTVEGLTSWNTGEKFASLGIGHYIWYPAGRRGAFEESFPEMVSFLAVSNVPLPDWLRAAKACPWSTRVEFLRDHGGAKQTELRELLARTVAEQARFSANRLDASLPKMLTEVPGAKRDAVRQQFYRVANSPGGIYALIDYVNFKGEGTLETERYHGHGWGLLQVLEGMSDGPATREFAASAERVLTERVANSPPERRESRWLPGWKSRVATYASRG